MSVTEAPFIQLDKVSFSHSGHVLSSGIFQQLSLNLYRHQRVGLVGTSGCGKSTLLKLILGLEKPHHGTISCDSKVIQSGLFRSLNWFRQRVQYIPQDTKNALDPNKTVGALIAEPLKQLRQIKNGLPRIKEVIRQVGLSEDWLNKPARELSGGQAQRVAIARALSIQPDFLLADEPVSGIDLDLREQIKALLDQVTSQNAMGLLMVSHDISMLNGLCERILVLNQGQIIEDKPCQDIWTNPSHAHTRQLLEAIPHLCITDRSSSSN